MEFACHSHVLKWGTHDNESFQENNFTRQQIQCKQAHQTNLAQLIYDRIIGSLRDQELPNLVTHLRMPINLHLTHADTDAHTLTQLVLLTR